MLYSSLVAHLQLPFPQERTIYLFMSTHAPPSGSQFLHTSLLIIAKNFNNAAGKRQVSKDPDGGGGSLVFISGLGGPSPFQVASIVGPSERGDSVVLLPVT